MGVVVPTGPTDRASVRRSLSWVGGLLIAKRGWLRREEQGISRAGASQRPPCAKEVRALGLIGHKVLLRAITCVRSL